MQYEAFECWIDLSSWFVFFLFRLAVIWMRRYLSSVLTHCVNSPWNSLKKENCQHFTFRRIFFVLSNTSWKRTGKFVLQLSNSARLATLVVFNICIMTISYITRLSWIHLLVWSLWWCCRFHSCYAYWFFFVLVNFVSTNIELSSSSSHIPPQSCERNNSDLQF